MKSPSEAADPSSLQAPGPARGAETLAVDDAAASSAAPGEKLPIAVKLAYGMPNLAGAAMVIPIAIHMSKFYSDVVLVPLGYIALAMALARSFDALTDPLMGWISDRTKTRWGRRRPWMFVGAPLCAVAFFLLFSPPVGLGSLQAATWFGTTFLLYYLFHTVYSIPHYGLGPELTQDYRERSSLFAWMEGFTLVGTMAASVLPALLAARLGGERAAFTSFAASFGVLLTLLYFWQCYRIRERPEFYQRESNPLIPGVRRVMRNGQFRVLLASYIVGSITGAIPGLMMPFFTAYVLQPENPTTWLGIFLAIYFGSGFLSLPFWLAAVRRFGKKPIYIVSHLMGVAASLSIFFLGKGDLLPTALILLGSGSSFGVRVFLGPSIQGDVIDYDELFTGKRREAQFGALWAFMVKFTVIPSASIPLAILESLGYLPNVQQSETVQFAIRAMFGLAPAIFGALSLAVFLLFRINERSHLAVLEGIERHKRGVPAEDPLTGRVLPAPSRRGVPEELGWFLDHFSPRELRAYLEGGRGAVRAIALGKLAVAALLWTGLGAFVVVSVSDLSQKPGFWTVFAMVLSGFAFVAAVFHLVRLRAAGRLTPSADPQQIEAHLENIRVYSRSRAA